MELYLSLASIDSKIKDNKAKTIYNYTERRIEDENKKYYYI